ncbi:MAG: dual specificity protein phosphatase family protein [Pseudomonadaceae bacterium]
MKPHKLLLAASLPLITLAIVGLARPDVFRSDHVDMPAPTLSANQPRPADWAVPVDPQLRLYRMAPNLYRSALPDSGDLPTLQAQGITTVINFYQRNDDWLSGSNLTAVHEPLHADRVTDTDVIRVLREIRAGQQQGNVLIHCKHGQNRTGLMAAMYRIVFDGWSREQAMAEMLEGGFGEGELMTDAVGYLNRVDVNAVRNAVTEGECSTSALALCHVSDWWHRQTGQLDQRVAQRED